MNENVFMALTMVPFAFPFYVAIQDTEYTLALLIAFSGLASAMYHLYESQKHGLRGFPNSRFNSPEWNTILINIDRTAAALLFLWKATHIEQITLTMLYFVAGAFLVLGLSETADDYAYLIWHSLWHFSAATLLLFF